MTLGDPRVIMQVVDLSNYINAVAKGWVIVMGQSERGEPWKPTMFENGPEEFTKKFGNTVDFSTDPLAVINQLKNSGRVVFIRLIHCEDVTDPSTMDAVAASCLISDRGGQPTAGFIQSAVGPFPFQQALAGRLTGSEIGPFAITTGANDAFKVRVGVPGNWGPEQTATLTQNAAKTAQQACDEINAGSNGLNATVVSGKVHVEAINPLHSLEILTVDHDCYSAFGINVGVYARVEGTDSLVLSINGGANQTFDLEPAHGETAAFTLTSAEVVAQLGALSGATASGLSGKLSITSATTGESSSVQVQSSSTAAAALGLDTNVHSGTNGVVKYPWRAKMRGPGAYADNEGCRIYFYDRPQRTGVAMNVRIVIPGSGEEYFQDLERDTNSPKYWKNYINSHSELTTIEDTADDPNPAPYDWPAISNDGIPFTGGDDGSCVLTDADFIGDAAAKTGVWSTLKTLIPAIHIMAIGTSSMTAHIELAAWCNNQIGKFGHGNLPDDTAPDELVKLRMGQPPYTHAALDSCNYTLTHGWPEVFDVRNNGKIPIPAISFLGAAISKTDQDKGPSWAPFGVKRGSCDGVLGLKHNAGEDPAQADLFAEYGINDLRILPTSVQNRGWEGAKLWGNYTCQLNSSAFREFNVVWLVKTYELALYPVLLGYVFDPNHPVIWGEIHRVLEPYFRLEARKYAVYGYFIQTDKEAYFAGGELKGAVLNTGLDIDQGKYRCRILIQPTRVIRYLICELGVTRTGEPFANYSELYELPGWVRRV